MQVELRKMSIGKKIKNNLTLLQKPGKNIGIILELEPIIIKYVKVYKAMAILENHLTNSACVFK